MKVPLRIIFLIGFLLFFQSEIKANHILGSELYYTFVGENNLELNLKIYRDCNECKFDGNGGGTNLDNCSEIPPIEVFGLNKITGNRVFLASLPVSRIGITNITNSCAGISNKCEVSTDQGGVKFGIEVHDMIATLDISQYQLMGYCHFYFANSIFSRSNETTPLNSSLEKFFNYSELIVCDGIKSNSSKFVSTPNFLISAYSPIYHSPGVQMDDADSVSFKLVPALNDFNQEIKYLPGNSYKLPLTVLTNVNDVNESNPNAPMPTGFYFEESTGNTIFTPQVTNQAGIIVYEISKWKRNSSNKLVIVGKVRRDYMIKTFGANNYEPKFTSYQSEYNLCAGSLFSLPISVTDKQNVKFESNIINDAMLFVQEESYGSLHNAKFSWTTTDYDVRKTFYITVSVQNDNCPLSNISSFTYKLNVHQTPSLSIVANHKLCGKIQLEGLPADYPDNKYMWEVFYPNTVKREYWGRTIELEHLSGGNLRIELSLNQICKGTVSKNISMPKFKVPSFQVDSLYESCLGTNATIQIKNISGNKPLKYFWNDVEGSDYFVKTAGESFPLRVKVVDKDGCQKTIETKIKSYPKLNFSINDSTFCMYDSGKFVLNNLFGNQFSNNKINVEVLSSGTHLFNENGEWYFMKEDFNKDYVVFRAFVEDENHCKYYDTFRIFRTSGVDFKNNKIGVFCNSSEKINLYELYKLNKSDGFFESNNKSVEDGYILDPKAYKQSGNYEIKFYSTLKYCSNVTTLEVQIVSLPDISWLYATKDILCKNGDELYLGGETQGGKWTGKGIKDYYFNPKDNGVFAGKNTLVYEEREPIIGCSSKDSVVIQVYDAPSFDILFENKMGEIIKNEVCFNDSVFIRLKPNFKEKDFPFNYLNKLYSYDGIVEGNKFIPNFDNEIHEIYLKTESDICPEIIKENKIRFVKPPSYEIEIEEINPCELTTEIDISYRTSHTNKIEWFLNQEKVGESVTDSGIFILKELKEGFYKLDAVFTNNVCTVKENNLDTFNISPALNPIIIVSPSEYVPTDMRLVQLEDKGRYRNEIIERKWVIENNEYLNQVSLNLNIQADEGEVAVYLFVEDDLGCVAQTETLLFISPPINLFIPNAFSPNGKGPELNNTFSVNAEHSTQFEMLILDKWGETVFKTSDYTEGWDGTFFGADCPSDVYVYYIKVVNQLGGAREFRGTVSLIR